MRVTNRRAPTCRRRGGRATFAVAAALALVMALPVAALSAGGQVGEPAPAFEALTLEEREAVTLAQQRGTAVLLNKWTTWCRPCVREMPFLERLHQRHRAESFAVIGVSIDRRGDDRTVRRVADSRGVTYPIWLDPEDTFTHTFRSTGVPESVLIDRNGIVVRRWPGALEESDATIAPAIARAIAAKGDYTEVARREVAESSTVEFGIIGLLAAALAGLLSFLSPCVLPLVPSYLAFLAGVRGTGEARRSTTLVHACAFVLGFSIVFILLGISATALGGTFRENGETLARIGGVLLIVFGLIAAGLMPGRILQRDFRAMERVRGLRRFGPAGSGVVGAAFGAGWTPCIGPVLAGILALAASNGNTEEGAALLAAYSAGLAVPFLVAALGFERLGNRVEKRPRAWLPWVNRVSGVLLIGLGILLVTGAMTELSNRFAEFTPSWLG